jgi:hypothetical protein
LRAAMTFDPPAETPAKPLVADVYSTEPSGMFQ